MSISLRTHIRTWRKLKVLDENKAAIKDFAKLLISMNLNKGRVAKYIYSLAVLARRIDKPFKDLTRKDAEDLMIWLNGSQFSPDTKSDLKKIFKLFVKWLKTGSLDKSVPFPPEVSWIKTEIKLNERKKIEALTDDEIESMIREASSTRDKAFIAVLAEGGFRIGEILPARIKDVAFDEKGAVINVTGKTGLRVVRLITSAAMLAKWIEEHPRCKNSDAFLWPNLNPNRKYKNNPKAPIWIFLTKNFQVRLLAMKYYYAMRMLKEIAKRAGIKKRSYPNLFRHSATTRDARYFTESELKCGWTGALK